MNRRYIFLIVAVCLPAVGVSQSEGVAERPRVIRLENRAWPNSTLSDSIPKRASARMFDTHPMPNGYRKDYAVAMPNAYRGDNCVTMPNVYQEKPTSFITVDSLGISIPDSALMNELKKLEELEKLKGTLKKKQRLKAERP